MESGEFILVWKVSLLLFAMAQLSGLPVPCPELIPVLADQVKFAVNTLDRAPWRKANLQRVFIYFARHAFKSFLASPFPVLPQGECVE